MAPDPRTVTVHHPDEGTEQVTPEVASALLSGSYGPWTRDGADQARIDELEAELDKIRVDDPDSETSRLKAVIKELEESLDYVVIVGHEQDERIAELTKATSDPASNGQDDVIPEKAEDLITWIGDDADRAAAAHAAETQRDKPRKTVTDHIESVLNPTPNDPAANGQED